MLSSPNVLFHLYIVFEAHTVGHNMVHEVEEMKAILETETVKMLTKIT